MIQEIIDGSTCTDLYTDEHGLTWRMLERAGGSISFYYTRPGTAAHFVVFDSLDGAIHSAALPALENVQKLHAAAGALLAATQKCGE